MRFNYHIDKEQIVWITPKGKTTSYSTHMTLKEMAELLEQHEDSSRYKYRVKGVKGLDLEEDNGFLNASLNGDTFFIGDEFPPPMYKSEFTHEELETAGVRLDDLRRYYDEIKVKG